MQALFHGFNFAYLVIDLVSELLGSTIQLEAMIDSRKVFNVIAKDGQPTECCLQIDVVALHQSYEV